MSADKGEDAWGYGRKAEIHANASASVAVSWYLCINLVLAVAWRVLRGLRGSPWRRVANTTRRSTERNRGSPANPLPLFGQPRPSS